MLKFIKSFFKKKDEIQPEAPYKVEKPTEPFPYALTDVPVKDNFESTTIKSVSEDASTAMVESIAPAKKTRKPRVPKADKAPAVKKPRAPRKPKAE
jgi:hypothetical protein